MDEDLKAILQSLRDRQNTFEEQMLRHAERVETILHRMDVRDAEAKAQAAKHDYEIVDLRRDTRELIFENQRILKYLESRMN
jgi:hypothetical protein